MYFILHLAPKQSKVQSKKNHVQERLKEYDQHAPPHNPQGTTMSPDLF